jgi:DNA polymerase IV
VRKSIGKEITLEEDITDIGLMHEILLGLAERVSRALEHHGSHGRTITLKVKYFDFRVASRSVTLNEYTDQAGTLLTHAKALLDKTEAGDIRVRLLGISVSHLDTEQDEFEDLQLTLPFAV